MNSQTENRMGEKEYNEKSDSENDRIIRLITQ